ncbi:sterol desaturase family protein [Alteromonas gracilis]|uniref:sterol desaturase family protein n=1 Tax=Alteromonas gracilis TaxID=1479524 RepID=UPI002FDFB7D6
MNQELEEHSFKLNVKQKLANALAFLFVLTIVLPFLMILISDVSSALVGYGSLLEICKRIYWYFLSSVINFPLFLLALVSIFVLQNMYPVLKSQRNFNRALVVDLIYFAVMLIFYMAVASKFFLYLKSFFSIPELTLWETNLSSINYFWQLLIGYLAVDFLGWFHHLVRHKVPFFWAMHSVHHSQKELNPFSNERVHFLDWFVANIIKFSPALFFTESLGIILNYIIIHKFLDHLNHANIKTNLGPFRYIFVTPQSHRVHHSSEKEFFDKNFGVSLSIWDHLFGTQCKNYDAYPATGVPDKTFPNEQDGTEHNVLSAFVKQQIYPFKKMIQYLRE